jgi:hypothetical protein
MSSSDAPTFGVVSVTPQAIGAVVVEEILRSASIETDHEAGIVGRGREMFLRVFEVSIWESRIRLGNRTYLAQTT